MSRVLRQDYITRLVDFRIARRLTIDQLKLTMNIPVRWPVIKRALLGLPVQEPAYIAIVQWIDCHLPAARVQDRKLVAAGERPGDA
jgi:hypothetical protein